MRPVTPTAGEKPHRSDGPPMRRFLQAAPAAFVLLAVYAGAVGAVQQAVFAVPPEDPVQLTFVDAGADRQSAPFIDVRNAYPGMRPHTSDVGLRNWGRTPVFYDLGVVVTAQPGRPPLAEVLKLTIRGAPGGDILYRGALADASVVSTRPLAPGATAHYSFTIRWDDGGTSDNRYQGQRTTFRLEARGRTAE